MKYYQIKSEGKWFAKVPGADADPNVKDGREYRNWQFGEKSGSTLGWFKKSLEGLITGAEVKPLGEDMFFCIYLDNGDVAQWKLYESTFLGLSQILAGINLTQPIRFDAALNEKRAWTNKYGKRVVPTALYVSQGGDKLPQTWPYDADNKWFTGLPKPQVEEKFGRKIRDTSLMEAAFDAELDSFIQRIENFSSDIDTAVDNKRIEESVTEVTVSLSDEDLAF